MLDVMVRGEALAAALVPMAILMAFAVVVTLWRSGCSGGRRPEPRARAETSRPGTTGRTPVAI